MSSLETTDNTLEKNKIRQKIRCILDHAESLKESLRPKTDEKSSPSSVRIQSEWPDVPQVIKKL